MNSITLRYTAFRAFFVILAFAVGFFCLREEYWPRETMNLLQLSAFMLLGLFYLALAQVEFRNGQAAWAFSKKGWYVCLLLALQIMVALGLYYLFTDHSLRMAAASTCIFLLPFTIANAWAVFSEIPERRYKYWSFPLQQPEKRTMPLVNRMPVRLRMKRRYADGTAEVFFTTVPVRIQLGLLFYYFLLDNKDGPAIEYRDETEQPYEWEFYVHSAAGIVKKHLDPGLTLSENAVGANATIIARRIKGKAFL